ncbi:DNA topoisomerase III [Pseudoalteromonas tunicata D2]|uniref:DNA topoisomerase III n=1 Tax=Pseudoalteromonas tunicata D2 TaxID=87626 RepID=A4C9G4_9GAMM|nr:DNA topoisomerase III [Pseudoalteromonas tunicata D2]
MKKIDKYTYMPANGGGADEPPPKKKDSK